MKLGLGLLACLAAGSAAAQTCVFSLSPASASFAASGGNDLVNITLVSGPGNCSRTATSNANWVTISFGTPGTGSGTLGYTVQANPFTVERTGTMTIAGQTFTVTQAAGSCAYSLSPSSASVATAGGNGSFTLTANPNSCPWTVTSNAEWIGVTSAASGTGTTTVRYSVSANSGSASRSGTLSAAGLNFTVNQPGLCAFTLNPASVTVAPAGGTGTIAVTASASSCAWTASSNHPEWLTLTGAMSGTGNGSVTYSASANTALQDRAGSISIGGSSVVVVQPASACTFALSSTAGTFPAGGGNGSFFVNSACPWTPATATPDWILITSPASTTGTGTVTFIVAGNLGTQARSGSITIGNASFAINQAGVACAVTIAAGSGTVGAPGGTGSIPVTAPEGCIWTASTTASWLTLAAASGSGNGDVTYSAAPNTAPQPRSAVVTIANRAFTLTQDAAVCDYVLTPASTAVTAAGGSGSFTVATSCSWSATTAANWITFPAGAAGTGPGTVPFAVAANPSPDARTGTIRVGGQVFTVVQTGRTCTFAVTPETLFIPGRGGRATAAVTGDKGCRWEPSRDQPWLTIDAWSSIDGTGSVTVSAKANPEPRPRTATLLAGGRAVAVTQGGLEVILGSAASVLNAASFEAGPVAPGEIVTLFGEGIGPLTPAGLELSSDRQYITTTLAGVKVLFDGIAAPLIYVSEKQVSVQVPYGVAGRQTTELRVVNQGVESNPLTLPVTAASPAIFTVDASGKGQGAILNQDGSLNSASSAAARNTIIQIFATGEGQTRPAGEDGKIAGSVPLPAPQLPVTVLIGGQTAAVTYAGAAPGAIAGLFQVNARVPQNAVTGRATPVVVRVGSASSPAGVTVVIR